MNLARQAQPLHTFVLSPLVVLGTLMPFTMGLGKVTRAAVVDEIRTAWSEREKSTDSFRYEYTLTRFRHITPTEEPANDPFESPTKASEESRQMAFRGDLELAVAKDRMAFHQDIELWDASTNERVLASIATAFDGNYNKSVSQGKSIVLGEITASHQPDPGITVHTSHIPLWLAHKPLSVLNRLGYVTKNMKTTPTVMDIEGKPCAEIVISRPGARWRAVVYVDPARAYLPVRLLENFDGRTRSVVLIQYASHDDGGWVVSGWSQRLFDEDGEMIQSMSCSVKESELNRKLDESDYEIHFPAGAHIVKREAGQLQYVTVAEDGSLRPIPASEYGALKDIEKRE